MGHLPPVVVPPSSGLLQLLVRGLSQADSLLFGVVQRRLQLHNQLRTNTDGFLLPVFQGLGSPTQPEVGLIRAACVGKWTRMGWRAGTFAVTITLKRFFFPDSRVFFFPPDMRQKGEQRKDRKGKNNFLSKEQSDFVLVNLWCTPR